MRIIASIITGVSILSLAAPAFAKDTQFIRGNLLPAGFCTVAADGSVGVTLQGVSYSAWFIQYALNNEAQVYSDFLTIEKGNALLASQDLAMVKKAEAQFQRQSVSRGQQAKCL